MAGTLLHITLADAALKRVRYLEKRIAPHVDDYHLGAVVFDLPYYERLWYRAVQLLVTKELGYSTWGQLFHLRDPSRFVRILLQNAHTADRRAFALGVLTHLAVDLIYHPWIESRTMAIADGSSDLNRLHKQIEDDLDRVASMKLLGHTGIGTPYAASRLRIEPTFAYVPFFAIASGRIHGATPSFSQFERWRTSLRRFGRLHQSPRFPWIQLKSSLPHETIDRGEQLAESAIKQTVLYLEAGMAFLEKLIDVKQFADRVPSRNLINGHKAEGARPPRGGESQLLSQAENCVRSKNADARHK